MIRHLQSLARLGCAMILFACASESEPTGPRSPEAIAPPPGLDISMLSPEEIAALPPELQSGPSLIDYRTVVGFVQGEGAFAQAIMDYFATNAEQTVTLGVRSGNTTVGSKTQKSARHVLLPFRQTLITTATIPLGASCGHIADGAGSHHVWHQFIVQGWKFLSWGNEQAPSNGDAEQPACEVTAPPGYGGGTDDDEYDGGCEVCQQWFYIYVDGHVTEWWECRPLLSCADTI